jgi:hypothetical protein
MSKQKMHHFERLEIRRLINVLGEKVKVEKLEEIVLDEMSRFKGFIERMKS